MTGRKKTYLSDDDKMLAAIPAASLFQEIMKISGLNSQELSDKLSPYIELSADQIRQYKSGKIPASNHRLAQIAKAAFDLGWTGPNVMEIIEIISIEDFESKKEYEEWHKIATKDFQKREDKALRKLEESLSQLMKLGWNETMLVSAAIAIVENSISPNERTLGGIVSYRRILSMLGINSAEAPDPAWVDWRIRGLSEVPPADLQGRKR